MSKPLTTLGDLMMSRDPNWRAELRALEIPRRPSNAKDSRPDRGYVEQPEERASSEQKTFIRRREERPTLEAPVALIRPIVSDEPERVPDDRDIFPPQAPLPPPEPEPEPEPERPQQTLVMLRREPPSPAPTAPGKRRRIFRSPEFIRQAVERVRNGETQSAVGLDLGIHQATLSHWCHGIGRAARVQPYELEAEPEPVPDEESEMAGVAGVKHIRRDKKLKAIILRAYLSREAKASELSARHGIPQGTIQSWAAKHRAKYGNRLPAVPASAPTNGNPVPVAQSSATIPEAPAAGGSALDRLLEQKLEKRLDALIEAKLMQMLEKKLGG